MLAVEFGGAEKWIPTSAGTTILTGFRRLRLAAALLMFMAAVVPARAEDLAAMVAGLGGDSFAAKEKAVIALSKSGDPRAVPILQALIGDRLRKAPDGRVVIVEGVGGGAKLTDFTTGQPVADLAPDSLERVIVNNRLRGAIEAALGTLTLFSPDREARLGAAQDALRHPSADTVVLLQKALAAEQDPEIRTTMQRSLAASQLFAGSKEERLAAIRALGTATPPTSIPSSTRPPGKRSPQSTADCAGPASPPIYFRASAWAACCCWLRSGSRLPSASWASSTWRMAR